MRAFLRQPKHRSWLIAGAAAGLITGVALSALTAPQVTAPYWLLISLALSVIALSQPNTTTIGVCIAAGLLAGLWRGDIERQALANYALFYGHTITLYGIVSDDTAYGQHGDQRLVLKNVTIDGTSLDGQVWASTQDDASIKRSDIVVLTGKLGTGFAGVSGSMFQAHIRNIVRPNPGDIGLRVRDWFANGVRQAIPEPEASLANGYLVGQRSALPPDLDNQLKIVGLTHAVVASGYNLTILVTFTRQLLLGMSKYLATLSAAGMIIGFVGLSGLSPSMTRAALVTGLSLAAWYYGRKFHPLVLLLTAAATTAAINPFYIWGDIGWYLSFTSFAGVIILAPLVEHAFWQKAKPGFIMRLILETMAAQVATLPIMVFAFGHYSPYALVANLLVLSLIPCTMLLTFIAGIFGLLVPPLAHVAGLPATYILRYMVGVVEHVADLPGAQGDLQLSFVALAATYAAIVAAAMCLWLRTGYNPQKEATTAETAI